VDSGPYFQNSDFKTQTHRICTRNNLEESKKICHFFIYYGDYYISLSTFCVLVVTVHVLMQSCSTEA